MSQPCTLILTVWKRGYLEGTYTYHGPAPARPYTLTYRRGTTPRHGSKRAECWPSNKPDTFKAECILHQLKEWQEFILPQNGFMPVLP